MMEYAVIERIIFHPPIPPPIPPSPHPPVPQFPYDLQEAAASLTKADEKLGRVIDRVGPCNLTLRPMDDPFESLLRAIVYQQLSSKAASTIYQRVQGLFPSGRPDPHAILGTEDEILRSAGMSWAKIASANDLASKMLDGMVPPLHELYEMADDEIIARLSAVRGIGRWTVEMLLIFSMGRPDVLPATDLGIRKGFQQVYQLEALPAPKKLDAFGERWKPFRSVASWYLWRVVDGDDEAW